MTKIKEPRPNESYFGWEEGSITFIDEPVTRGGPGSGHFGHKGRLGEVGGSLPGRKGVTRPITPAPGKKIVAVPTGVEGEIYGARKWIVISDEEIEEIRGRSVLEIKQMAWEQTLAEMPTSADREQRIEAHLQYMEHFHKALQKYIEEVRPRGGWTSGLRRAAHNMRRAIENYREDGNEIHLTHFWGKEGSMLVMLMRKGDEEHGMSRQSRPDSELYQIMRDMEDEFDPIEAESFNSPITAFYHMDAVSSAYEFNRTLMMAEREGYSNTDRWTSAILDHQTVMDERGNEFRETAERIAFELGPYENRREMIEVRRATNLMENSLLAKRIEEFTSEIDTIISAGGTPDAILAQTGPLQTDRAELYAEIAENNNESADLVDMEYLRREQMRDSLIRQLKDINSEVGQGDMRHGSLTYQDGNWVGLGINFIGDSTYWELLRDSDRAEFDAQMTRAAEMAKDKYEERVLPGIGDGLDYLNNILPRELKPDVEISIQHDGDDDLRAHYVSGSDLIELEAGDGANTVIHELGHFIEDNNERLEEAAVGFLLTQGEGYPIRPLADISENTSYDPWEVAFDGAFEREYSGKVYYAPSIDDYKATEVISMGLEQLYVDPVQFARTDPDHYAFMISLLSGELLKD